MIKPNRRLLWLASAFALAVAPSFAKPLVPLLVEPIELSVTGYSAQPSVVADSKRGHFVLSWQAKDASNCSALRVATLKPGAKLSKPSQAGAGCNWFVNWADFPSLGIADNGDWLTYWLQKNGAGTYAYDIQMVRSQDQGHSWQMPFSPHHDGTLSEHGFVSLAPIGGEKMLAVWLDGRKMASDDANASTQMHGAEHSHDHSDAMTLRSAIIGRAGKLSSELEIDASVCSCCSTDLVRTTVGKNAKHTLVFRDRSDAEIRDIGLARYQAGNWQSQGTVHADNWKIAGCPVNGPALASSRDQTLVVWTTQQGDVLSVRARNLAGKTSEFLNLETGAGVLGRVDAAPWGESNWLVSWLGAAKSGQAALYLAELDSSLQMIRKQAIIELPAGRNIGMPRLASLGGQHAILLWTQPMQMTRGSASETQIKGVTIGSR